MLIMPFFGPNTVQYEHDLLAYVSKRGGTLAINSSGARDAQTYAAPLTTKQRQPLFLGIGQPTTTFERATWFVLKSVVCWKLLVVCGYTQVYCNTARDFHLPAQNTINK